MFTRKKNIVVLLLVVLAIWAVPGRAQQFPLPENFVFDGHSDMRNYTKYIVPCVNWLQQTPLSEHKKERAKVNSFVMNWLQINPDLSISLPEYSYKLHDINEQLLYLFMEGWIKHSVETKDNDVTNCSIAGIRSLLDYYKSGKAAELGRNEFLEHLADIDRSGKLRDLFDSGRDKKNTYLYLKKPPNKDVYKYDENYFDFNFYCINLVRPRSILYRYLLEGYFDHWIETKDGSVTYPRLPPGSYTFRVQGSMYPDFRNASEQSWSFTIKKPLWKEDWFIALMVILGITVVYLFVKQRERNLKNIALLKHERIMFEYEHLKSQVNPHFLFNSLNTLTNLIARDQKKAIAYTENLSTLYHSILAHHDNDLVLLQEEIAILENYFSIQKGRFGDSLMLNMNISPEILRTRKIVPLAMQILIENVIKHNVISASEPLIVDISATEEEITIRNIVAPKLSKEKGEGLGLMNIKRRYELLTKKQVSYGLQENEFVVILPLL